MQYDLNAGSGNREPWDISKTMQEKISEWVHKCLVKYVILKRKEEWILRRVKK